MQPTPVPDEAGEQHASVSVVPGPLVGPLVRRVVGVLAARADLPVDRLDDAVLVADLLAGKAAEYAADGRVRVRVASQPGALLLSFGPLAEGSGSSLLEAAALPGLGAMVDRLADESWVDSEPGGELLGVRLAAAATA